MPVEILLTAAQLRKILFEKLESHRNCRNLIGHISLPIGSV